MRLSGRNLRALYRASLVGGAFFACAVVANGVIDLDGDGLGDVWQLQHGVTSPTADPDGDGQSNATENAAATNPFSSAERFSIGRFERGASGLSLGCASVTGKRYQLLRALSPDAAWTTLGGVRAGTGGELSWVVADEAGFFRVQVLDVDSDGDGVSDWEELALGLDPALNPSGNAPDDLQAALSMLGAADVISVSASAETAMEGGSAEFTISRTGSVRPVTVRFVLEGTASASDYAFGATEVRLGFSQTSAVVTIPVSDDATPEPPETLALRLLDDSAYVHGTTAEATVTIPENDVPAAGARTFFVATTGSDSAFGQNRDLPFRTIQHGSDSVAPGDTVVVLPGVYSESVVFSNAGAQPVTFRADAVARGRVIISGAKRTFRDGAVEWTAEATPGIFSAPLDYTPIRVLSDDIDLFPYQSLGELTSLIVNDVARSGKPGPGPLHGWAMSGGRIYVRLHPSGKYGSTNPTQHVMRIAPRMAAGFRGDVVEKASDYNFAATTTGPANVVLDGFTFETPGLCGVYAPKGGVTVRNSWFIGCRTGVAGTANTTVTANDPACADVLVENCSFTEQGVMEDVREVVEIVEGLTPAEQKAQHTLFWWHRKGGPLTYEYGIVAGAGDRWTVRRNHVSDTFDAISFVSSSWSREMVVEENIFENLVDNGVELEERSSGMRVRGNLLRNVWEPFTWQPTQNWPTLPDDAEFHHNVIWMDAATTDFWLKPLLRRFAGCFKIFSPGLVYVTLPTGVRFHHNTFWHPAGNAFNTGNLGDFATGFSFEDNIVVSLGFNIDRPNAPFPNMTFARNVGAPSFAGENGPGSRFAGTDGVLLSSADAVGFADAANGDLSLLAGSPATGAGALAAGQPWTPPNAGPQTTPLAQIASAGSAPIAQSDSASTWKGKRVRIYPLANDSDADRDLLTILSTTQGAVGRVVVEGGALWYTPNAAFSTGDSFSYTIGDGNGNTASATVAITRINAPPVAAPDSINSAPSDAVLISALANDTDADGDTLGISAVGTPTRGSAVIQNGAILYTATDATPGADSFTYTVADGNGGTAVGTVNIASLPLPPVAVNDTAFSQNGARVEIQVLANDHDGNGAGTAVALDDATQGAQGKVVIKAGTPFFIRYEPFVSFTGSDTFTYTIRSLSGATSTATVTVTRNQKPVPTADTATVPIGAPFTLNVLSNDTDADGDTLAILSTTAPTRGTLTNNGTNLTYTPTGIGTDTFTYTATDGHGGTATGTVTLLNFDPTNTIPVAVNDVTNAPAGSTKIRMYVLANDGDPDGDPLTISAVSTTTKGTCGITTDTAGVQHLLYRPNATFTGTDTVTYTISDGRGGTATAQATVNIGP